MSLGPLSAEQLKQQRIDRQAREAKEVREQFEAERNGTGVAMVLIGFAAIAAGVYFLIVSPGQDDSLGREIVNLQRLFTGQALLIMGAVFAAAGFIVRYSGAR